MPHFRSDPVTLAQVRALIDRDLRRARDDGDLAQRLARNGYGFADTATGRKLVTLPHGHEVMDMPPPRP